MNLDKCRSYYCKGRSSRLKHNKFLISIITMFIICMSIMPASTYAEASIKVLLNGQRLGFDVSPVIERGRTLVPFRVIGETLGARVDWNQYKKEITCSKDGKEVLLKVGSNVVYVDNEKKTLDMYPIVRNGRTLVPLRFISEAFGASVSWNKNTRTVSIDTKDKISKHILGYYYSQSYDDFLRNYDKLSSTAVKWYTISDMGNVISKDTSRYIMTPDGYEDVIEHCKDSNTKIYMMLFESKSERLEKIMSTPESRSLVVKQILDIVEREGYDGVNIDFEYLKASDRERFNLFAKELYSNLKAKGKTLSFSLPVKTEKADWWPGYDFKTLGKYSDFIVLMAYDKNPASPEPQSGIDWVEDVVDYAIARIPAHKVVLGIGYYGYDWSLQGRHTVLPAKNGMTYSGIVFAEELKQKYGLDLNMDPKSGMAFGTYIDDKGISHQIWMESDVSVDAKAKLVIRKGLKGVGIWRLGYTTPSFWNTLLKNFKPAK